MLAHHPLAVMAMLMLLSACQHLQDTSSPPPIVNQEDNEKKKIPSPVEKIAVKKTNEDFNIINVDQALTKKNDLATEVITANTNTAIKKESIQSNQVSLPTLNPRNEPTPKVKDKTSITQKVKPIADKISNQQDSESTKEKISTKKIESTSTVKQPIVKKATPIQDSPKNVSTVSIKQDTKRPVNTELKKNTPSLISQQPAKIGQTQKKVQNSSLYSLPQSKNVQLDSPLYTPMGAERKGSEDGLIPTWSGTMLGTPLGIRYGKSGSIRPNPYKDEQPMFIIHNDNYNDYKNYLSEGLLELLKKYPDTFYMPVYPSHRDGRFYSLYEQRTAYNKLHTKLVNGIDGLRNYTGGIPFPAPQNGAEVMWNSRVTHPQPTIMGVLDDIAIFLNGNKQVRRQKYAVEFPFANPNNPVGKVDEEIGINAGLIHITIDKPERQKGQMTVVHETLDQVTHDRKAWVYVPGSRRVRRAPTVGHDTPDGPGGLVTVDDSLGFNGAMERYNWELVGKKAMYVPYHAYLFDDPNVDYETLLPSKHSNPDYMRYELHRVWVVEATLKPKSRHVYAKRRFYIDEDSWQIVLLESYDGRGDLWRVGILNTLYDFAVKGYVARAQMFHDLQSGSYIALRLINETSPSNLMGLPKGEKFYSPANLRKMGTR